MVDLFFIIILFVEIKEVFVQAVYCNVLKNWDT